MLLSQQFISTSYFWGQHILGQQNNSTYGLRLHRKILLFNLNSIIIRQTSLNCFPDSTGQMYEKCLLLSTPSPTQPEQDIILVAPTMNNYQNSFQDVTFYFSLMPQIVKLWSLRWVGINHLVTFQGRQMLRQLSWKMAIPIHIHNHQVQLPPRSDIKWMGLSLQSDGYGLVCLGVLIPSTLMKLYLLQRPHMGQFSV